MARLHRVASARKSKRPRVCRRCGKKIKVGQPYYWFANRIGRSSIRKDYCQLHRPRGSDMTTSDKLSRLYAARESVEDAMGRPDTIAFEDYQSGLVEVLNQAAEEAREVGQEYRDSKENMPESLQEGPTGEQCEQSADSAEQWADELEQAANDIEAIEVEADKEQAAKEQDERTRRDEVDSIADNALGNLEL